MLQAIHVFWNVALCCQVFLVLWMIAMPSSWGSGKVLQSITMLWDSSVSASHHWGQGSSSHTLLFGCIANLCLVRASAWTLAISISFMVFLSTRRLVPRLRQAHFLPDALWFIINPLNVELNPICHLLASLGAHRILHISRIRVNRSFRRCVVWSSESVVK